MVNKKEIQDIVENEGLMDYLDLNDVSEWLSK